MCGFDIPLKTCKGDWNGTNLPVLTLAETEEYLYTPKNIISYLVHKVNWKTSVFRYKIFSTILLFSN